MASLIFCDNCGAGNQADRTVCFSCGSSLAPSGEIAVLQHTPTGLLPSQMLLKQRYRILRTVGQGGMGAVYKAEDTQLGNRQVAVKEMGQHNLAPQEIVAAAENFKQEAHMLARLNNPALPSIHDYFTESGRWYLVMSFIPGETLHNYLDRRGGKLPLAEALQIALELCQVLEYLHTQKPPIIFRDLKPANIIRSPQGKIYLIDFGIARHFKPGQAKDTTAFGSAGYAAPEQYGRAQTTPRSDIYSLGAILYQMLTGWQPSQSPFNFPPLHTQNALLPSALEPLLTSMLTIDEKQRPRTMQAVQQELQHIAQASSTQVNRTAVPQRAFTVKTPTAKVPAPMPQTPPIAPVAPPVKKRQWKITIPRLRRLQSGIGQQPIQRGYPQVPAHKAGPAQALARRFQHIPAPARRGWFLQPEQILPTIIGIILCGALTIWLDHDTFPTWFTFTINHIPFRVSLYMLIDMITLVITIFCGAKYGPWSGLLVGGAGPLIGDYLFFANHSFGWNWDIRVAIIGFIVGLSLMRGHFRSRTLNGISIIALLLGTAFSSYTDMTIKQQPVAEATTIFLVYSTISIVFCLLCQSILYRFYKKA